MAYARKSGHRTILGSAALTGAFALGFANNILRAQDSAAVVEVHVPAIVRALVPRTDQVTSRAGNYTLPISVADRVALVPIEATNEVSPAYNLIRSNSATGKWTYISFIPRPTGYPTAGCDTYMMFSNNDLSMIAVTWVPEKLMGTNEITALPGTVFDSPPAQTVIDGKPALMTRLESKGTCYTLVKFDRNAMHYEVQFMGPDFKGPDGDAFLRVMNGIRLRDSSKGPAAPQMGTITSPQ